MQHDKLRAELERAENGNAIAASILDEITAILRRANTAGELIKVAWEEGKIADCDALTARQAAILAALEKVRKAIYDSRGDSFPAAVRAAAESGSDRIKVAQKAHQPVTVGDLKCQLGTTEPRPMLKCFECGAGYSANRSDYFTAPEDHVFECCGEPMHLVTKHTVYKEAAPSDQAMLRILSDDNQQDPISNAAVKIVDELHKDIDAGIPWHDERLSKTVEEILRPAVVAVTASQRRQLQNGLWLRNTVAPEVERVLRNFAGRDPAACLTAGSEEDEAIQMADKLRDAARYASTDQRLYPCPFCGCYNEIVNQCGCDKDNLPTKPRA